MKTIISPEQESSGGTYFDNVNKELLAMVDPSASAIVECGCGAGGLARAIKAQNPSLHYVGLELVAEQLSIASDVLDVALCRDLDAMNSWAEDHEVSAAIPAESQDHIIFGDVLEHLYWPETAVSNAVTRLKPGGSILACIPNVEHWSVFAQLVLGRWPRDDAGLFDRTHIRWFTLTDMIKLMTDAGLVVDKIISRVFPHPQGEEILEYLEPLALHLGRNPEDLKERGKALQFVICAKKPTI